MSFMSSFPDYITNNSTIQITIGGDVNKPAYVDGSNIKNLQWYFKIPQGLMIVNGPILSSIPPQGTIIQGGGTLGKVSVVISHDLIKLIVKGTIHNKAKFIPPAFNVTFMTSSISTPTTATINILSNANPAYSVDAGSTNVKCSRNGKKILWTQMMLTS